MTKKIISIIFAFMMITSTAFCEGFGNNIWEDASNWAISELMETYDLKLFPDKLVKTNLIENINRTEFAAIAVTAYEAITKTEIKAEGENPFSDTSDENVIKAYQMGFTTGISETEFGVDSPLTREQASTMLGRVYEKATQKELTYAKENAFSDDSEISDWAKNAVYFMNEKEIVKGTGNNNFSPKNNISREAALIISLRMTKSLNSDSDETTGEKAEETTTEEDTREKFKIAFIGGSLTEKNTV